MTTKKNPKPRPPKRRRPTRADDKTAALLRQRRGDWFERNVIRKEHSS